MSVPLGDSLEAKLAKLEALLHRKARSKFERMTETLHTDGMSETDCHSPTASCEDSRPSTPTSMGDSVGDTVRPMKSPKKKSTTTSLDIMEAKLSKWQVKFEEKMRETPQIVLDRSRSHSLGFVVPRLPSFAMIPTASDELVGGKVASRARATRRVAWDAQAEPGHNVGAFTFAPGGR